MGKALMMRRGAGGNDLNFRVHVGSDEPTVLMENTVWIDTDLDVSEWAIAAKNPYVDYRDENLMSGVIPVAGVLNTSGNAAAQNTTYKEVYTEDYLPVEYGVTYRYEQGMTSEYNQWFAICEYTLDRVFVARQVLVDGVNGVLAQGTYAPSKDAVAFVRMTWRTYGDAGTGASLIEPNVEYTPDSVAYGTVWIQMANGGNATINALRSNALMFTLSDVQGLIGRDPFDASRRTWMALPGYVYQNGEWVEIKPTRLTLYNMGDTCSGITGGWTKSGGTLTFNTDHMKFVASGAAMHTVNRIDLTDYSTLRFSALSSSEQSTTTVGVGAGTAANDFAASVALPKGTTAYRDFDVDVSDLTGAYYIKVQTTASSVGCCVRSVTLL